MTAAGDRHPVFTFWEPRGSVTPWLQLCRETWDRSLPGWDIVTIDYANLHEFVAPGTLDLDALKTFRLAIAKDAIMLAVLHRHGGLFLDMDTLVLDDIGPVLANLRRADLVNFGGNLSFLAARPGTPFLTAWLKGMQANLALVSEGRVDARQASWDYLGNAPLGDVMLELGDRMPLPRAVRSTPVGRRLWPVQRRQGAPLMPPAPAGSSGTEQANRPKEKLFRPIARRIAARYVRSRLADQVLMLDRTKTGFYPELRGQRRGQDHMEAYQRFWFSAGEDTDMVFRPGVSVVGLHNQWTPDWYRSLSREEVLAHPSRLSAALRRLLVR